MTLDANLADLVRHAKDFEERTGFTYSMLDGDEVILRGYCHREGARRIGFGECTATVVAAPV